jgi:steroid 5-alpha reductase family enzyme
MADLWWVYGSPFIAGVIFVLAFFVIGLWLASIALKDSSIVDIFWGFGCAAMAWIFFLTSTGAEPRAVVTLILATLWGARLGVYIGARNWGGEDRRYARLRQHITDQGRSYVLYSLRAVFLFQGIAMVICTLPLLVAIATPGDGRLGLLGGLAAAVIAIGLVMEALADWQMAHFRRTRTTQGVVMDRGLWRYSRHPNYFGEMLVQWGFFLMACAATPLGIVTIIAPALLSYLITGPMGANLLERRLTKKNPDYEDYIRRTSAFVPWPPKPTTASSFRGIAGR